MINRVLKVGLTGGIGSGKSTVAKIFELLKVPVYYADAASKRLYHSDPDLIQQIKRHFGEDIYKQDQLDRSKLASIVFNNPDQLDLLNSLVHPPTIRDAAQWMSTQTAPYVIKEAALIFESGSGAGLDYIIGVASPESLRFERVMERDKVTREEVLSRSKRQINDEIKIRLCDFVIHNNEIDLVIPQVIALHHQLMQLASNHPQNKNALNEGI